MKTLKTIYYNLLFILIFPTNESIAHLLKDVLQLTNPLTSALGIRKHSKLSLIDVLSGTVGRTPDGELISEGDIVVPGLKGVKDSGDLWPNGVIPYIFHNSVDNDHKNLILEAMEHWEESSCIRFKKRSLKDIHYIRFRTDTSGCWSSVGRQFNKPGPQDISLGSGCFKFYTAVHEIGHTIGYFHEHARIDRDQFIEILWNNVKPGMNTQFEIRETRNEGLEYDYRSIMHYPTWAFSKSPLIKSVIVSKNPMNQYLIDEEKETLSFRDIKLTNILYKCDQKCKNFGRIECKNGGFLSRNKTKENICICFCPIGFGGTFCEIFDSNKFIDYSKPKCGGNITEEGLFSTPNYPLRRKEYESCSYWIRAPINHRVKITFHDFSFGQPYNGEEKPEIGGLCLYESVEIRNSNDIYSGSLYCGEQIAPQTVMESKGRNFIIIIIADDEMKGRGLKASVEFMSDKTTESDENQINLYNVKKHKIIKSQTQSQVFGLIQEILK